MNLQRRRARQPFAYIAVVGVTVEPHFADKRIGSDFGR